MANPIPNLFKIPELKEKILFTLMTLFIYRVGAHITAPGIDVGALREQFGQLQDSLFGVYDMFVGGALSRHHLRSRRYAVHLSHRNLPADGARVAARGEEDRRSAAWGEGV